MARGRRSGRAVRFSFGLAMAAGLTCTGLYAVIFADKMGAVSRAWRLSAQAILRFVQRECCQRWILEVGRIQPVDATPLI